MSSFSTDFPSTDRNVLSFGIPGIERVANYNNLSLMVSLSHMCEQNKPNSL